MWRVERLLDAFGDRIVHAALLSKPLAAVISQNSNTMASTLDRRTVVNPGPPFRHNIAVLSVAMLLLVLIPLPLAAQGLPTQTTVTAMPQSPSEYLQLVTFTAMVTGSVSLPNGDGDIHRWAVPPLHAARAVGGRVAAATVA